MIKEEIEYEGYKYQLNSTLYYEDTTYIEYVNIANKKFVYLEYTGNGVCEVEDNEKLKKAILFKYPEAK